MGFILIDQETINLNLSQNAKLVLNFFKFRMNITTFETNGEPFILLYGSNDPREELGLTKSQYYRVMKELEDKHYVRREKYYAQTRYAAIFLTNPEECESFEHFEHFEHSEENNFHESEKVLSQKCESYEELSQKCETSFYIKRSNSKNNYLKINNNNACARACAYAKEDIINIFKNWILNIHSYVQASSTDLDLQKMLLTNSLIIIPKEITRRQKVTP